MKINTVIFDLGNVLINFSHDLMFNNLSNAIGIESNRLKKELLDDSMLPQFERGLISTKELYEHFCKNFNKPLKYNDFIHSITHIFSPNAEMQSLLKHLHKKGLFLILLSNTNKPHFEHIHTQYNFLKYFNEVILSYQVGFLKPERKIYEIALQKGKKKAKHCFFIDDCIKNIQGAEILGIKGHHFVCMSKLMEDLVNYGILD